MGTDSQWQALKTALRREIEAIFAASGEIILIESLNESGSELMLSNRTASLKLKDVPERDAVRWETDTEYSFDRISEPIAQLARTLIRRLPRH
jgi:hypothetical protein